ncbi:MAG: hypothetical protein E7377_05500 [Clostridiales bacterium]|nr:hypothetical protein [Clostridiales bacterium]
MDAKITKKRLSHLLSYDWLKIVGLIAAAIIVWTLIFTMTATRITPAQQFTVLNYNGNVSLTRTKFSSMFSKAYNDGVFSYEVLETTEIDLPMSAEYAGTIMEARVATSEGDVIFVSETENTNYSYKIGEETYYDTYLQNLVSSYGYLLYNLDPHADDSFFGEMKTYVNRYYQNGNYETGTLNKEKVESDFRARIIKNKDKRFKKETQIVAGLEEEIKRIEKYAAALTEFYGYLDAGLIESTQTVVTNHETGETVREGIFSLNICPNKDTMGKLSDYVGYYKEYEDESGNKQQVLTAENMNVAFFNFEDVEEGFQYESLLFVNALIRQVQGA